MAEKSKSSPEHADTLANRNQVFSLASIYLRNGKQETNEKFDTVINRGTLQGFVKTEAMVATTRGVKEVDSGGNQKERKSCVYSIKFHFLYSGAQNVDIPLPPSNAASTALSGNPEDNKVAHIEAEFCAFYYVNTPEFPSFDEMTVWGQRNVMTHVWPYWREYCHSTLQRMGLPVTVIPLLAPQPLQEEQSKSR